MEYDIFISYSRADRAIVDTFVQQLESAGYKVWIDRTGIYSGARFKSVIVQAIEDSRVFMFFSSKDANVSSWTSKEIAIAVDRKKTIIPIKLDKTRYSRDVEFDLINLDFVDYSIRSRRGQESEKLMRTLGNIFGKKPTTPKQVVQANQSKKASSLLENHRRWVITLAVMALLLIVGVPLYYSATSNDFVSLVESAEQGDPEAQYNLGRCYYEGDSVTQDYNMAVKWFKKAAEQGHANAQNDLGFCYERGYGVTMDDEEAVKWFRKAAEQGLASAQNNLGYCYRQGYGVTMDDEEAVKWFRKAAEKGNADAHINLGHCYRWEIGVSKDVKEALRWYRKAAELGDCNAQDYLGLIYYCHDDFVTTDYEEAVKWFRKAAEAGDGLAQYHLGLCYEEGHGVTKDMEKALECYRKAAEQGIWMSKEALKRLNQKQ